MGFNVRHHDWVVKVDNMLATLGIEIPKGTRKGVLMLAFRLRARIEGRPAKQTSRELGASLEAWLVLSKPIKSVCRI